MPTKNTTVSLVLGSGGARGLVHIGVISWLEERDFSIRSVAGASMGALVGGIYGSGKLDEFTEWVRAITKFDMLKLLDFSFEKGGLVKGERVIAALKNFVGDRLIEDLPISFTAVATDIADEKEIWINSGPVFDAIRASISLPLFFTPHVLNDMRLLDGGILNPVPIAPTFNDDTDITLAVNLGGPLDPSIENLMTPKPQEPEATTLQSKIQQFIDSLQIGERITATDEWDMYDVANQSFDAMQSAIARQKLAAYPPDIVLELPRNTCGTMEFDRADEMISLGYVLAEKNLAHLV
ncbi:MAG: patatin-like phospholipase family protein [Deltaproteobacteria bacterium]|nr:patatin-like phospholipase family protein [Deltaproteobacteria bacterium]